MLLFYLFNLGFTLLCAVSVWRYGSNTHWGFHVTMALLVAVQLFLLICFGVE